MVGCLGVALTSVIPSHSGSAAGGRVFPEGNWTGTLWFTARVVPVGGAGAGAGSFEIDVADGQIDGPATWEYAGVGISGIPNGASVTGRFAGLADAPMLFADVITTGTVTVDNTGAAGIELDITSATCEMVEGTGEGRPPVEADGHWSAVRSGSVSDPAAFTRESAEIAIALEEIEAAIAVGDVTDSALLFDVIDRALALTASIDRSPDCLAFGGFHRMVGADIVSRLLTVVLDGSLDVDTAWFADIVLAALEAGVIGAGAADPGAETLELAVIDAMFARVEAAAAAGDSSALFQLGALAQQMGYRSIEDAVLEALVGGA